MDERGSQESQDQEVQGKLAGLLLVFDKLDRLADLPKCALVCKDWHRTCSHHSLWQSLSFQGKKNVGERLEQIAGQPRFHALKEINLEFGQKIENKHIEILSAACPALSCVNLNACQNVGDAGVAALARNCPGLEKLSVYWNLKLGDTGLQALGQHCPAITDLNLSGCKHITDAGVFALGQGLHRLLHLNLTRCSKITDAAVVDILQHNPELLTLNLYSDAALTDASVVQICSLERLQLLDLCGMVNLTDEAVKGLGRASLTSLNLTWCINITEKSLVPICRACPHLRLLSVHGIKGVTDAVVDALAATCPATLEALDVRGCINVQGRAPEELLKKLPNITNFAVHS